MIIGGCLLALIAPCAPVGAGYFRSVAPCTEIGSVRLRLLAGVVGNTARDRSVPDCLGKFFQSMTSAGRGEKLLKWSEVNDPCVWYRFGVDSGTSCGG